MEAQENTEQVNLEQIETLAAENQVNSGADPNMDDPVVRAVLTIQQALKMARGVIRDKLTGTQAKAVLEAVLEHPLEKEAPNFTTDEAHHVFYLADVIASNKIVLFQASLEAEMEKAANSTEENNVANGESAVVESNTEVAQEQGEQENV